jgi:hypothetical protein
MSDLYSVTKGQMLTTELEIEIWMNALPEEALEL